MGLQGLEHGGGEGQADDDHGVGLEPLDLVPELDGAEAAGRQQGDAAPLVQGDEGGELQNGAANSGDIPVGDIDLWRFTATAGDSITRGACIMEVRAGTGGDEAALFAKDLYDMYSVYCEQRGWKTETLEFSPTELGGLKEVVFSITGDGAFHSLQFESGGHRVQRVPTIETQGRIHTSAATVAVLPEADEVEMDIRPEDLQVDTMRAGGPGGQKVNKTESAVRLTHLPTGIVVKCQDEKSQHKNRAKAMRVLRSRILEAQLTKNQNERAEHRRTLVGSGDRSERIRTYNFPQNRITDHRCNLTLYKLDRILIGDMGELITELLAFDRNERLRDANDSA